jgi:1,4-dihydroxy-2-naphthoate octaprenyltransferase
MTPMALLSLSRPHTAIASLAASASGPMEVLAQVSGYLFAILAVILIIAAIEAANHR